MKVLVTGASGFLGRYLVDELAKTGCEFIGLNSKLCDLTDAKVTNEVIKSYNPTHIIHAAAYTDVAKAETDRAAAYALNVTATKNIVQAKSEGCRLIYISTDAVYSGDGPHPIYPPNPISYYGLTKLLGEIEVDGPSYCSILRVCFYGRTSTGRGLIEWLIRACQGNDPIHIYSNHWFSPLHVRTTANLIVERLDRGDESQNLGSRNGMSKAAFICYAAHILKLPTHNFIVAQHPYTRDLRMKMDALPPISLAKDMVDNLLGPIC